MCQKISRDYQIKIVREFRDSMLDLKAKATLCHDYMGKFYEGNIMEEDVKSAFNTIWAGFEDVISNCSDYLSDSCVYSLKTEDEQDELQREQEIAEVEEREYQENARFFYNHDKI